MSSTGHVQYVRGAVGPKVLSKSHELFKQDLRTILHELLQNARRAKATRIDVRVTETPGGRTLSVRDNGEGVADFQKLLTFGDSAWSQELDHAESAAGMGFFSLASRGALVRSNCHRVNLAPSVFIGEASEPILDDPEKFQGTEVTLPVSPHDGDISCLVSNAARYLPVDVYLDGNLARRGDFLEQAGTIVEWSGIRIGIGANIWQEERTLVNFHGVVSRLESLDQHVTITEVDHTRWAVRFDVVDTPDLKLVLPTRDVVIVNDFTRALQRQATLEIYRHIASRPHHTLSYRRATEARSWGVAMPDAKIILTKWQGDRGRTAFHHIDVENTEEECIVVDGCFCDEEVGRANLTLLTESDGAVPAGRMLGEENPCLKGYPAYDALRRIAGISTEVTVADVTFTLPGDGLDRSEQFEAQLNEIAAAAGAARPDAIIADSVAIKVWIEESSEATEKRIEEWVADTGLVFTRTDPMYSDPENTNLIAVRSTRVGYVARALVDLFFVPSDDRDDGSHEEQEDRALRDAFDRAREILLSPAEARIRNCLSNLKLETWLLASSGITEIVIARAKNDDAQTRYTITAKDKDGISVTIDDLRSA